jgi:nitrogenase-stabilizing/protective protein
MGEARTMTLTLVNFKTLTNAEEYLQFFDIPYDPQFVNINRLHILKQFSQLIQEVDRVFPEVSDAEKLDKYREALTEAYELFKTSSPLETKLFKVFKDKPKNIVLLQDIGGQ